MRKLINRRILQKLVEAGVEPLAIAQRLGVAPSGIYRHIQEIRRNNPEWQPPTSRIAESDKQQIEETPETSRIRCRWDALWYRRRTRALWQLPTAHKPNLEAEKLTALNSALNSAQGKPSGEA